SRDRLATRLHGLSSIGRRSVALRDNHCAVSVGSAELCCERADEDQGDKGKSDLRLAAELLRRTQQTELGMQGVGRRHDNLPADRSQRTAITLAQRPQFCVCSVCADLLSYWRLAVTIRVSPKWGDRQTLKQWHGRGVTGRMPVVGTTGHADATPRMSALTSRMA